MIERRIKVLLADDLPEIREGWRAMIQTADDMEIVGDVSVAQDTLRQVSESSPDVVLMDLSFYGDDSAGAAAIRELKERFREVRVIALTVYPALIPAARRSGADIARTKGLTGEHLLDLIRSVVERGVVGPAPPEKTPLDDLTPRELDVLRLMMEGSTNQEIADKLIIALNTVTNHVGNILSKLGAKNRTEAANLARAYGLTGLGTLPPSAAAAGNDNGG